MAWATSFASAGRGPLAPVFALGVVLLGMAAYDRWAGDLRGYFFPDRPTTADRAIESRQDNRIARGAKLATATAIDGDSLRRGGEEIRLLGIDAPEYRQTCRDERGRDWACGREARAHLERLLSRGPAQCVPNGRDRYGRTLARCSAGNIADLGEAMVRAGYALDFMGGGYGAAEAAARAGGHGIWRGQFERPADWRRANPRTAQHG
ncbi:MAG: thermonuclease family protein [Bradyrhizobiaceae bacterium]|nr:thermonuclease family protein [Bradyrhizobiaceae bacterium]